MVRVTAIGWFPPFADLARWSLASALAAAGFAIAALFVVVWVVAIAVWKLGHIDRRWRPATAPSHGLEPGNEN
jgi:hypothetical protein